MPQPPHGLPSSFLDAWNDADMAVGTVANGVELLEHLLASTWATLPLEEQNRLGFLVESLGLHVEAVEARLEKVAHAAADMVRPQA
ncbi:hypothetical protein CR162_16910 [Pseudoroseomonas rhizosphaerae]|uniref:Uncharacterized protein n=1 Tax=Teichococcus rhizosphaerae TaxID=1335062 RepID=A0A2C7A9S9_9PROT|nr:hypothetical protein CR162_16910 [Pseudoroseomonas rhizosphaerae]